MSYIKYFKTLSVTLILCMSAALSHAEEDSFWTYEMQKGDNVWQIAHELLTDWRKWQDITELNNVSNDRLMAAGTVLKIPRAFIQERPASIQLIEVAGPVSLLDKQGEAKLIEQSMLLAGDVITTGDNGSVLIKFEDNTEILITPNSELAIETANVIGSTDNVVDIDVKLRKGEAEIHANPTKKPGSRFIIRTPTAFATTRGTVYRVRAAGDLTAAEVTEGKIDVTNNLGNIRVPQNFGTITEKGKPPRKPTRLLAAPELDAPETVRYLPARVSWNTIEKAQAYRSQVSDKPDFSRIVLDNQATVAKLNLPVDLADGKYWLRVRGIDKDSLQGLSTTQPFIIDARPFPPVIQSPMDHKPTYSGEVQFSWTTPTNVNRFHFELALDEDFKQIVKRDTIADNNYPVMIEEPGQYFWRVTSENSAGKVGPAGYTNPLTVKPVPATPELEAPVATEDKLGFGWQKEDITVKYQVQLSTDSSFENIVQDVTVNEASALLDKPETGTYYFRVRGFDSDDFAGGWSAIQQIEVPIDSYLPLIIWTAVSVLLFL